MKKVLVVLMLLAVSAAPLPAHSDAIDRAHKTTHQISLATVVERAGCSATAIGPHALITATHCELGTDEITIDEDDAKIFGVPIRDGNDHTIFLVDATFADFAHVSFEKPVAGDHVFIFGNPGELSDIYREGYVAGVRQLSALAVLFGIETPTVYLYDMNAWHGDSGAAIFNEKGEIAGIVSTIATQSKEDEPGANGMKLTTGLSLAFTSTQLNKALAFVPPAPEAK